MSIDAKIRDVEETAEGNYLLQLEPRRSKDGWSCMGQRHLTIEQPTWKPTYGMAIWGGSDVLMIGERKYQRLGYTRIKELGSAAKRGKTL